MQVSPPKLAILGAGRVGLTLAIRLARYSHPIFIGTRDQRVSQERLTTWGPLITHQKDHRTDRRDDDILAELPELLKFVPYSVAVDQADAIILAVPWKNAETIVSQTKRWAGKLLIDCINPLNATFNGLDDNLTMSAAEHIAEWAPEAHVIKAFNTVGTEIMANPIVQGRPVSMFYCGDSLPAKDVAASIIQAVGFAPVDCGPLKSARYLESMAMLFIDMAVFQGYGTRWGIVLERE